MPRTRTRTRRARTSRRGGRHHVVSVAVGNGQWAASCRCGADLGTGNDAYVSYVVAIHQGNHLPG